MFCNKCGNKVEPNQQYCNKCGNKLTYNNFQEKIDYNKINYSNNININSNMNNLNSNKNRTIAFASMVIIAIIFVGIAIYFIFTSNIDNYYFDNEITDNETEQTSTNNNTQTKGKYQTDIITDNVYHGISVDSVEDADKLIIQDSTNQKISGYSKEIIQIENSIIENYKITAVNLKEMDVEFAKELENVIKNIYIDYPNARGYLTNLTLTNLNLSQLGTIALFRPIFIFGTSDTNTTRPWVIKTQIELNSSYFLNPERIESAVETSSKSGHFPPNATKYSPVAHELGHYLSFIALLNNYDVDSILIIKDNQQDIFYKLISDFDKGVFSKKMLDEAYQNYVKDNGNINFDEWRGQISEYALAKDDSGEYIYDETIAEAFHDVYLNGEDANPVSKYIVEVLKKYIEG